MATKSSVMQNEPRRSQGIVTEPEPLRPIEDVAEHLGATKDDVYGMNRRGLPRVMIGRQARYRLSEVDAWLESHRRGDSPDPK